jgi:hypothetical protein
MAGWPIFTVCGAGKWQEETSGGWGAWGVGEINIWMKKKTGTWELENTIG